MVRSPQVAWIEAHRDVLEPAANKLYGPEAIGGWMPGNPDALELSATNPEEARAYWARLAEEQKAWHAYADWVFKNIKPPPPDMRCPRRMPRVLWVPLPSHLAVRRPANMARPWHPFNKLRAHRLLNAL
ncbi:MAG: hypothetical protein ACYCOR_11565 [Acidobacteriaceae bacterium]